MEKEKVLNLDLLFSDEINSRLIACSQHIHEKLPGPYVLGLNSLPHISVVQMLDDRSAEEIWALARPFCETPLQLEFQGLYFDQGRASGKIWFGIRIAPTEALIQLQQDLIAAIQPTQIINGTGITYFPHATLGCGNPVTALPAISFMPETTMLESVTCQLALGRSGPNLQFAEKIC